MHNMKQLVDTSLCWPKGASGGRLKVSGRQIKKQTNKQTRTKTEEAILGENLLLFLPIGTSEITADGNCRTLVYFCTVPVVP